MERTHRLRQASATAAASVRFNPCCDGTDSSTILAVEAAAWHYGCFNPCCDGTDSSTSRICGCPAASKCFNPCCDGTDSSTTGPVAHRRRGDRVSILVVMERTHRPPAVDLLSFSISCFNPCCDGTDSSTICTRVGHRRGAAICFNPCCDGTDSSTRRVLRHAGRLIHVSILVVMERTHRLDPGLIARADGLDVSILVVMERTHRRTPINRSRSTGCCFNPCCDGTDSSTRTTVHPSRRT